MPDQSPDDKKKKLGIAIAVGPANKVAPPKSPFDSDGDDDSPSGQTTSPKGSMAPDDDADDDMGTKLDAIAAQLALITNALGLNAGAHQPDQSVPQGDGASSPYGGPPSGAQPSGGGQGPYGQ